ncbi:MAG: uroporphyrinogen decarboxylase [Bacteroidales bacterium]
MSEPILLQTLNGKPTSRPPVWYMRQAGRILPSYLKLKEKYTFWQMLRHPKVAAEVTLLPVNELEVDAAILFSDILVIPFAMGMGLDYTDDGPVFETPLTHSSHPLDLLSPDPAELNYIYDVVDEIIKIRPSHIPLIGFCGAPLTVLLFMLQGPGRKGDFPDAVKYIYKNLNTTKKLVEEITNFSIIYAKEQIRHGVDVFQLFDTHAGVLPFDLYQKLFMPSVEKIAAAVREENIPFIFFPKGLGAGIAEITPDHCDFLSIDWQTSLPAARNLVHPEIGLQGNVDPRLLHSSQEEMEKILHHYIEFGTRNQHWIFNLGHGFIPGLPFENARFLTQWVKNTDWKRNV